MGHSNVRIKARRRKVALLKARSHQFDLKNHQKKVGKVETIDFKYNKDSDPIKAVKFREKMYIREGFGKISLPKADGSFEISQHGRYLEISNKPDKLGLRFHMLDHSYKQQKNKQPKSLCKRKRGLKPMFEGIAGGKLLFVGYTKYDYKSEFSDYTIRKMNHVEYMEKLVEHKMKRWERKNPCPIKKDDAQQDLFEKEYLEPWNKLKEQATERIRDFVISIYDKLKLIGRFKINDQHFEEKLLTKMTDVNGEGHIINELDPEKSVLLQTAQRITDEVYAKDKTLVCTNLKDHKGQFGRIILPNAA